MAYEIVFTEEDEDALAPDQSVKRGAGEHVFLSNLPKRAKVFVFYYQGSFDAEQVEDGLRELGQRSGDNLFVNIGSLVDPDYRRAVQRFEIGPLPAIVVTAISPLAATPNGKTAYVRLDSRALFADPARLVQTVEELFNLFLAGRVAAAITVAATRVSTSYFKSVVEQMWAVLQPAINWVASRDLTIALLGAKIEVKAAGKNDD